MSRPSLITTTPVVRLCDRCRSIILAGISEGLRAEVDMVPLSQADQLRATLARIELYWLTRAGLWYIDHTRARSAHKWTIVPAHRCDVRWTPSETELPKNTPTEFDIPPY